MNTFVKSIILVLALVSQAALGGYAQEKTDTNSDSLGDVARHLKAEKAKEPKPVKVFTNDNLVGSENDVSTFGTLTKEDKSPTPAPEGSGTKAQHHDEAYYHSQMSALKGTLETHQRELDVMQQKLGQNQMQFYNDPNKSLQQQYSREDINKLSTDIDAKKQQVADDNKAIDDLRDQLRHEGGDPRVAPLSEESMSRNTPLLTILLLSVALPLIAHPQREESLGNVARQLREQKESNPRKATKVFTNDNLPEPKPGEAISSLPLPPEPPSSPNKSAVKPAGTPSAEEPGEKSRESQADKVKTRDYWQDRFKAARHDVAKAKEQQQLADDELNLLQIQQVRELDSMAKQDLTDKVQAKQSEVDINKAATEAAQKALNDLDKEFKDSGAPEDWSQTDLGGS